jgi:thiol:disulfide interchange protein DsbD
MRQQHRLTQGDVWQSRAICRAMVAFSLVICLFLALSPGHARATDFLDPAQAFQFSAQMADSTHVDVHYKIAKGYYLYKERFRFATESPGVKLGEPAFPPAEVKFDETFGKNVEHYREDVTVRIPVAGSGPFTLVSTAQGCADAGLCYPPQEARASLDTRTGAPPLAGAASATGTASGERLGGEMASIEAALQGGNLFWIAVLFVGLGLLLSLTPCVWPMFPILSSIIAGDAGLCETGATASKLRLTKMRGLLLAVAYSLGIAVIYTGLGVAAGLAGEGLAQELQRPAVLITFALVLALLSLSMFGVYQLQMPAAWQSRLTAVSGRAEGGRFIGVFFMGAASALVVGPCVAAPLAGVLLYISQTHNVWIGGTALFSLAIGMCLPLLVLGASEGVLLPRAGAWMEAVKGTFGVLLLAVAIWMASPVLAPSLTLMLWALLLVVSAVFMHAFDALPKPASGWQRLWKGVGLLLFIVGVAQVIGAATGAVDPLKPLANVALRDDGQGSAAKSAMPAFEEIHSISELDARLARADKPILLDFTAEWCVACKEMERNTYSDQRVARKMADFVLLKADVTANSDDERALMKRFSLFGPPGIILFAQDGKPLKGAAVIGYQGPDAFLTSLQRAFS